MLKRKFNLFQDMYKEEQINSNSPAPNVYYAEDDNKFIFYMKNWERWEFYTIVYKSEIIEFADYTGDNDKAIDDFKLTYCSHAKEVEMEEGRESIPTNDLNTGDLDGSDSLAEPSNINYATRGSHPLKASLSDEELKKSNDIIDAGEDIIEESEDYEDFFKNVLSRWEKKVVNSLDKIEINKGLDYNKKTFGEFIQNLLNTINTKPFLKRIQSIIVKDMKAGLESAEDELNMDIGFTVDHKKQAKVFENQQLNGYTIQGKRWHGIKGATKQLQFKILEQVETGVKEKKTLTEITQDVKSVFKTASDSQAVRIARTESSRFVNESKLISYQDSNIVKGRQWKVHLDDRTSDIDKRLEGQIKSLDEPFVDPATGAQYMYPPSHPNCRCTTKAVLKKVSR